MSIVDRVRLALERSLPGPPGQSGFSENHRLILAVSGGPDSLCLLHLLCQEGFYSTDQLIVAHLNHSLRSSAGEEAAFVTDFASQYSVPVIVKDQDVADLARREGLSVEEAGRKARYQFFAGVAREKGAQYILTGHHADDQVETIVMHLLRGSTMTGLRGMQLSAPLPGSSDLTLIRPLLDVSRNEIEAYCADHGLTPVMDESNQDTTYHRNRLRHDLIPLLEEYKPGIRERLRNMAVIMNDEESLLEDLVGREFEQLLVDKGPGWLALDRSGWRSTPIGLQRRVVRRAIHSLLPDLRDVGFRTTEQAREVASAGEIGSLSSLPAGVSLLIEYDRLLFSTNDAAVPTANLPQLKQVGEFNLPVPGRLSLENGWVIRAEMLDLADSRLALDNEDPWQAYVAVEEPAKIEVRTRRPGERFRPLGMFDGTAKVSRVMIDRKIPERLRARWPIVADQNQLLWLVGHQIDQRVRVDADGRNILYLQAYREVDG